MWNWTWGELIEFIMVYKEKERRAYQNQSVIAFRQAELISSWVWKREAVNVSDVFPYWTEEEKNEQLVEKYKNIMWRHVKNTHINK